MSQQTIRMGIVGAGAVARIAHLPGYIEDPRVELVGVVDTNRERAQQLASEVGIPGVYPSVTALVREGGAQAVSVCVPNTVHGELAIEAMRAGADVLLEKPMTVDPAQAEEVVRVARETGRILMIGMTHRFTIRSTVLKRYQEAGRFGTVYHGRAIWMRRRGDPGGWFTDSRYSGGGALMDIGVHALDLTWWLMGCPRPVRVSGATHHEVAPYKTDYVFGWPTYEHPADARFDVDDFASALVHFENGAALELSVAWAVNGPDNQLDVDLYGTRGGARLNPPTVYSEEERVLTNSSLLLPEEPADAAWKTEMHHFVDVLVRRGEPLIPGEQGVTVVRMLDAISRSAREGRDVVLD